MIKTPETPEKLGRTLAALVAKECSFYNNQQCLLTDDYCVQYASRYGVYCNFFIKAILSNHPDLIEKTYGSKAKTCMRCREVFIQKNKTQCLCPECVKNSKSKPNNQTKRNRKEKTSSAPKTQKSFRPKDCQKCGLPFYPTSPRQKICRICKSNKK